MPFGLQGNAQDGILQKRRAAREIQRERNAMLLARHERAVEAMFDCSLKEATKQKALRQIALWEKGKLCHKSYITKWRKILDMPYEDMRAAMLATDSTGEGEALRQNSPFGWMGRGE